MNRYLKGALAAAALAAMLLGPPVLLLRFGTPPLTGIESMLDSPGSVLSDTALLSVLSAAVWVAWAAFALCTTLECASELTGLRRMRIPLLGPFQASAGHLVGAVILVVAFGGTGAGTSRGILSPQARPAGPPAPAAQLEPSEVPVQPQAVREPSSPEAGPPPSSQPALSDPAVTHPPDSDTAPPPTTQPSDPQPALSDPTVTQPPDSAPGHPLAAADPSGVIVVAPGDSPWSIAETHLGDGRRWRELFDANQGVPQPDGSSWSDPQLISVGWRLRLPGGAPPVSQSHWVVAPGDTLSGIAAQVWGDPSRYTELFERNVGRPQADGGSLRDPNLIVSGWVLELETGTRTGSHASSATDDNTQTVSTPGSASPAAPSPPATTAPSAAPSPPATTAPSAAPSPPATTAPSAAPSPPATTAPSASHGGAPPSTPDIAHGAPMHGQLDVAGGDIAASALATAGTPEPPPPHTAASAEALIPLDPAPQPQPPETSSTNPSAPSPAATPTVSATTAPATTSTPGAPTPAPAQTTPAPASGPPAAAPPPEPRDTAPLPASTADPLLEPRARAVPVTPPEVSSGSDEVLPLVVSRVLGISGAVVLATALLERVRRGHERRATRAAALIGQTAPEEAQPAARAMAAAADLPLVRWAGQSLAEAMSRLDTTRFSAVPVAVELGDDGIKVLWDRPVSELPAPWTAQDGGWGWSLAFDEDAEVAADSLPSCIPALVTVGRRDRRALLVNLEAFGALGVSGPATRTDGLLRSMASELTLGEQLSDAYVGLVGVNPIADPTSQRAQRLSVSTALERVTATVNEIQQVLAADGCATSFSRRAGRSGIPLEVVAIIASGISPSDTEALLAAARPHCGVGVAVADQHGHCPTRIVINEDGYAVLYPLGIGFEPAHLPARTADEAAGLVIASEQVDFDERPSIRGSSSARSALPEGALLVKVLGTPRIDGGRSLGPRETSLIAYLACRERPATTAHIQEALWGGRPVQAKTIWNLISRARQGLGVLDSGKPAFPQSDQATRTFRLAPEVITDLELLRAAVACTEATGASRPSPGGLELDGETRRTTRLPNDQLANDQLPTDRPPSDQLPNDQLDLRAQLAAALGMVEGRPFDAPGYDWAFRDGQHAAEAADLIERASLRLAEMALRAEDHGQARWALATGLTGLPGNEPLYRKRMSIEAAAGNRAGVESTFDELCRVLVDLETVPSAETIAHRQRLREAMLSRVHH